MKKIKAFLFILLALITHFAKAQEIYSYEKKISTIENYTTTEIESENTKDNVLIKGTLTEPKTNYTKIVIIVPGSGKDSRNSHYKLTEKLLDNNIAVYRYDERGCGLSTGKFNTVSYGINDMTNDLEFVFLHLKNHKTLSGKKIGLIGHSLGGMATMGLLEKNITPDFLIQWASPVQKGGAFLKYQFISGANPFENELIFENPEQKINVIDKINKVIFENRNDEDIVLFKKIKTVSKEIGYTSKNYKRFTYANFPSTKELIKKNLEPTYKDCQIKTLYIIGENDTFVEAEKETALLESFHNPNIEIIKSRNSNHYLKKGKEDIATLYEIEDEAANEIIHWINKQ